MHHTIRLMGAESGVMSAVWRLLPNGRLRWRRTSVREKIPKRGLGQRLGCLEGDNKRNKRDRIDVVDYGGFQAVFAHLV